MKIPDHLASKPGLHALQFLGRTLFALLVGFYFLADEPSFGSFSPLSWMIWVALAGFLVIHAVLLYHAPAIANSPGALLDLISIGVVTLLDPGTPPPALVLLVVATLSAGLVYGLRRFLYVLAGSMLVVAVVIPARQAQTNEAALAAGTLFLLAVILVCVVYFGLMVYRNQVLARRARDATWRDPDTGLISHTAMISTAGWLLPLHDRLSSHLTLLLLRPSRGRELKPLADQIATRLRRSDIAGRYDQQTLAVLLPDTPAADAERLLEEMRNDTPDYTAAMLVLSHPDHSLEAVLQHLRRTLERASEDGEHWLVHAAVPER
jgi:hypothetical protein